MSPHPTSTPQWNDEMFERHPTPYHGLAGLVSAARVRRVLRDARIAPEHRVLEIGCEAGHLLRRIPPCRELVGADISPKAVESAKARCAGLPHVRIVRGDAADDDFLAGERFDRILCSETLEHTDRPERLLRSIHRLLRPDGLAVVSVPLERYKNRIKQVLSRTGLMRPLLGDIEAGMSEWHLQDFSEEDLLALLEGRFRLRRRSTVWLLHQVYALDPVADGAERV